MPSRYTLWLKSIIDFNDAGLACFGGAWAAQALHRISEAAWITSGREPFTWSARASLSLDGWPKFLCNLIIINCSHLGKLRNLELCCSSTGSRDAFGDTKGGVLDSPSVEDPGFSKSTLGMLSAGDAFCSHCSSLAGTWSELAGTSLGIGSGGCTEVVSGMDALWDSRSRANTVTFTLHACDGRINCLLLSSDHFSQCFSYCTWPSLRSINIRRNGASWAWRFLGGSMVLSVPRQAMTACTCFSGKTCCSSDMIWGSQNSILPTRGSFSLMACMACWHISRVGANPCWGSVLDRLASTADRAVGMTVSDFGNSALALNLVWSAKAGDASALVSAMTAARSEVQPYGKQVDPLLMTCATALANFRG